MGSLLLTGATGLLGGQVLARYLESGDRHVVALVRAGDDAEADRRVAGVLEQLYGPGHPYGQRVTALRGDVERPSFGLDARRLDELTEQVDEVLHGAASIEFSLPLEQARSINLGGTRHALEVAERCRERGGLRQFGYVSTTYVAGDYDGCFHEDDLDIGQTLRNTYERSKLEADQLVHEWRGRLPLRVFRPGIIVGEAASGWTSAFNVLYYPVKLFAKGANLPLVPARYDSPVDAVPVDWVADAIFELARRDDPAGETYHLVSGRDATCFGELMDLSAGAFGRKSPRLMSLSVYMKTLHPLATVLIHGKRKRMIAGAKDFFPYFNMRQTFDDSRTRAALEPVGLTPPPLTAYFDRLLAYALDSNWGREPLTRAEARARAVKAPRAPQAAPSVQARPAPHPARPA